MSLRSYSAALSLALLGLTAPAHAELRPDAWFVEAGVSPHDSESLTAGVEWRGSWQRDWATTKVTGSVEAFASAWNWRQFGGGRTRSLLLGVVPLARLRFDQGRSPWFAEGGIGLSIASKRYDTPDKQFSTRWNFYDVLALGYSFGAERKQELSLRVSHVSNGGFKKPNPGENMLQLRWTALF